MFGCTNRLKLGVLCRIILTTVMTAGRSCFILYYHVDNLGKELQTLAMGNWYLQLSFIAILVFGILRAST